MIRLLLESRFEQQILANPKSKEILRNFDNIIRYDLTVPADMILKIGSKPTPEKTLQIWIQLVSNALSTAFYNNPNEGLKYLPYLFKQYTDHQVNLEDLTGELVDNIRKWWLLKNRNILDPKYLDLNRIVPHVLQAIIQLPKYQTELARMKNEQEINKAKKIRKEIVLIDNDRYRVSIPLNYGACYVFNNAEGVQANFCTGGSSGLTWFKRYAPDGIMLMVTDKQNVDKTDGKWQIHAATNQIVNSQQEQRWNYASNSQKFAELFPGLMQEIVDTMKARKEEITATSFASDMKYDVDTEVQLLKDKFPEAFKKPGENSSQANLV